MAMGLTPRQQECLAYLRRHIAENGQAPTLRELMQGVGISSLGRVHELLSALEERGAIRRLHGRSRAIEIIDATPRPTGLAAYRTEELRAELARRGAL